MAIRGFFGAVLGLSALTISACGGSPDVGGERTGATQEDLAQHGCREVCPKCHPGEVCPMSPCYLECAPAHEQCVQTVMCIQGYVWSSQKCACVADVSHGKPGSCSTDADCRLVADYCTSCACDALSTNQQDPVCSGPGVRCFVDPCGGHVAACVSGACAVQ